jgi:hypothetical protein
MANSGAFTSSKHWNDVNAGLRAANAGQLVNRIRAAMADLDEATANDYVRVLNIDSNFGVMPGSKGHRDRVRAALLIKLLIGPLYITYKSYSYGPYIYPVHKLVHRLILGWGGWRAT